MKDSACGARVGRLLVCQHCGRKFRSAISTKRYCCGWCENVAHRNESKRPVDVYLGPINEAGREVNAMRAALAEGRRI